MKKVFICSPYRDNIEENTKKAKYYAGIAAQCQAIPIAPHLYFPLFLDENMPSERMLGISLGIELMRDCDELWLFGFKITQGMEFELSHAKEMKIPIRLYDEEMKRIEVSTIPVDDRVSDHYKQIIKELNILR